MVKYAVKNEYGISLKAERKDSYYAYVPKCDGEESHNKCEQWIKRNDTANTCRIVEHDINMDTK